MKYYPDSNIYRYEHGNLLGRFGGFNILNILNKDFEIIQEQDEIDIQDIEEVTAEDLTNSDGMGFLREINKFNEIIRAIKQLDKNQKEGNKL